jgi:Asp-tRNA(Asn)/Glu-tRNA(Gln) amidotransferase A subunit family amidase
MSKQQTEPTRDNEASCLSEEDETDTGNTEDARVVSRRRLLGALSAAGLGGAVFQRALAAQVEEKPGQPTAEMIAQAEWIAGVALTPEQRTEAAAAVAGNQHRSRRIRELKIDYDVPPALGLQVTATPPKPVPPDRTVRPVEWSAGLRPEAEEDLAFLPVTELSALIRSRQVSSRQLTRLYLDRLEQFNPVLNCVVTLTESLALKQADQADREIASGRYRGPLHGIPWGAKDLIAYPGFTTTWGSKHFRDRVLDVKATVAERLDQAGAVLVAKLALGTLAWGDKWFNGMTRNPWNTEEGSSGSSAGSASATVAGLVGFSLGSETLGSIVSPCRRCGASGLRPTFGRVSRFGCMPLSWSMDKIGPICRSIEDCALVFAAIHGRDGRDSTVVDAPYQWPPTRPLHTLRVGYVESEGGVDKRPELLALRELGVQLKPIKLPTDMPIWDMTLILNTEAAAVFDQFTKDGEVEGLNRWPRVFRAAQFTPAIDYLQANRARMVLIERMKEIFREVDLYVDGNDLGITNLTGHPSVVVPNGVSKRGDVETPDAVTMTGSLYGEELLLSLARELQLAVGDHLKRPQVAIPKPAEKSETSN